MRFVKAAAAAPCAINQAIVVPAGHSTGCVVCKQLANPMYIHICKINCITNAVVIVVEPPSVFTIDNLQCYIHNLVIAQVMPLSASGAAQSELHCLVRKPKPGPTSWLLSLQHTLLSQVTVGVLLHV
jgi:recombinational DNA repair protein RecR